MYFRLDKEVVWNNATEIPNDARLSSSSLPEKCNVVSGRKIYAKPTTGYNPEIYKTRPTLLISGVSEKG